MLEFARWKYILVGTVLFLSLLFALPNFFGEDPALQVAREDRAAIDAQGQQAIETLLRERGVQFTRTYVDNGRLVIRFANVPEQLKARDAINESFAKQYVTALSFAPRAPEWLRVIGLRPMPLGLDLRGGLYLLYQVDVDGAVNQLLESYEQDLRRALTRERLRFSDVTLVSVDSERRNGVRVTLPSGTDVDKARQVVQRTLPDLSVTTVSLPDGRTALQAVLTPAQIRERQDYAIQQNLVTLRNRVDELGVSEPIVQRQGQDRINVQLPGVQNSAEVKDILGTVATLEFRLEDVQNSAYEAAQRGRAPFGSKLYRTREGVPVLLLRDVIATGDQLVDAQSVVTQEGPTVSVRLDSRAGEEMLETTRRNLGRRMGVVFIEKSRETVEIDGKEVSREVTEERIISLATIRGVFSNNFQITGLTSAEARELALLLRAGSLAAPIYIVEERVIEPTLGKENIQKGIQALIVGLIGIFVFMAAYYRVFGLVAVAVLLGNLVMLLALMSALRATLTLPGIAGIVLTLGMAVDANVLIYERIREELRRGTSPQAAIRAGFDKAFSAIADANITTLIAGIVLWVFGTGPIRGFAVTLCVGIATSMFTAILGSRALLTLMYGGRRKLATLPI